MSQVQEANVETPAEKVVSTDNPSGTKSEADINHIEKVTVSHLIDEDTIEQTRPGKWIWLVCMAVAGVDGLLFGWDTAVMNGVLVTIRDDLNRTLGDGDKELLTSITSAGAFITALASGFIADKYGRKRVMFLSTLTFFVGALLQAVSYSFAQMVIGRLIIGFGVGAASMIAPAYIAEVAPRRFRGRLVVIDVLCITGGQLLAYGIDAAFYNVHQGWRYMVGLAGIPAIVLFCLLPWLPESPRHLIRSGRIEEATRVIEATFPNGTDEQVARKIDLMVKANATAVHSTGTYRETFQRLYFTPSNLRALCVACGLMSMQQFSGFNTLMYYSSTLFSDVGFTDPLAVSVVVAATNFLFTCVSLKYVDIVGRRRMLVYSMWGMPLGLVLAAIGFHYLPKDSSGIVQTTTDVSWSAKLVLVSMMLFVAAYATGLGVIPWTATEFFPLEVRALATTMVTACNWGPNLIVSSTFLSLMNRITPPGAFGLYAAVCFIGWIAVIIFFPEAAGLPLEEVPALFKHGFGVRYSLKLREERKKQATNEKPSKDEKSVSAQYQYPHIS